MNHAKLERLKAELERCRDNASDQLHADYPKHRATVERRVGQAPAIHGTAIKFLDRIWDDCAVLSRQETSRKPLKHQACFETHDAVYASVDRHADPARVMAALPEQALLRIFELHVYTRLPLDLDRIEAVFLRSVKSLSDLQRRDMVPRLRRAGIAVEYYGRGPAKGRESNATSDDLRAYVTEWMCHRRPTRRSAP